MSYHIPKYQREYVWNKDEWEVLFDDIEDSEGAHFMGSIICIDTQRDSLQGGLMELVDGQQRMTTISLLLLALIRYIFETAPVLDNSFERKLWDLIDKVTSDDGKKLRLTPSYSNHNFEDYSYVFAKTLHDITVETSVPRKPRYHGNRRIPKAFKYFYKRLCEESPEGGMTYNHERAWQFVEKLRSATLVKIDVDNHADAFTLFETLNNRGVALSAIDIIKNKLLGHLERTDTAGDLDANFERWNQILQNLGDEYSTQERFLRQVYNAFKLEPEVGVERMPRARRSNLIKIYDYLIDRDANLLFDRLEMYSDVYSRNIRYSEYDDIAEDVVFALRNLENVNGMDGYMLLLFIEVRFGLTENQKVELVDLLCRYFIRRNVTDLPPTRDLTNLFMDMIREIRELKEYEFSAVKKILLNVGKPSDDELFERKLFGNIYEENTGATRFILASLEHASSGTRENQTNFYKRTKTKGGQAKFDWTIEHILPQGESLPSEWVDMVGDGDSEEAKEVQQRVVHTFGNLTLTAYNSMLSNMSFERKKHRKDNAHKPIGYNNGLRLNQELFDAVSWTEDNINTRTKDIVSRAVSLFSLDQ